MDTVAFATFCYHKDLSRMHSAGFLKKLVDQHTYPFNEVILIHQNCRGTECAPILDAPNLKIIESEDHPNIFQEFGIKYPDPESEIFYDGPDEPHYWPKHTRNHLLAAKATTSEYIVFQDSDITIEKNGPPSWVVAGIDSLNRQKNALVVCPSEGSVGAHKAHNGHLERIMSQQIFLIKTSAYKAIEFGLPFPYTRETIPANIRGPFPQYWRMQEGRICLHMHKHGLFRLLLDRDKWRYWHHNPPSTMWTKVM